MDMMFISHTGDIFPCCRVWYKPENKIGNLKDTNILQKILNFDISCECSGNILCKRNSEPCSCMNIEFGLSCNAACAICCVGAPFWRGKYALYPHLTALLDTLQPQSLIVQGGEVLAQPNTLEWLIQTHNKYPTIKIQLITNGNASITLEHIIKKIFTSMTISIVGFQNETYKKIMNIDIEKTKNFVSMVLTKTNIPVSLKYLITPLNLHESTLFLDWAIRARPDSIQLVDATTLGYINMETQIPFWKTIIKRSALSLQKFFQKNKLFFIENDITFYYSKFVEDFLGMSDEFVQKEQLTFFKKYY